MLNCLCSRRLRFSSRQLITAKQLIQKYLMTMSCAGETNAYKLNTTSDEFWCSACVLNGENESSNTPICNSQHTVELPHGPSLKAFGSWKLSCPPPLVSFAACDWHACDCLPFVRANVSLSHQNHTGFEEISTSRWSQYILKLSRSNSEESCGL